jgi:acetyl esterase/lipase
MRWAPPTIVVVGEMCPLRDHGLLAAQKVQAKRVVMMQGYPYGWSGLAEGALPVREFQKGVQHVC